MTNFQTEIFWKIEGGQAIDLNLVASSSGNYVGGYAIIVDLFAHTENGSLEKYIVCQLLFDIDLRMVVISIDIDCSLKI